MGREKNNYCFRPIAAIAYELVQHRPRGFAVIVNIAKGRPGSEKDVSMMSDLFSQLQYQVMTLENVTKEVGDAGSFIKKKHTKKKKFGPMIF